MADDRQERIYHWDRLRIPAMVTIVYFHVTTEPLWWGFGLPMFLVYSLTFSASRPSTRTTKEFTLRILKRLILPWVFWSVVFGVLLLLRIFVNREEPDRLRLEWEMLLYGPNTHLWFLPFIAVAGLVIHGICRGTKKAPHWALAGISLMVALLLISYHPLPVSWKAPFPQWAFSAVALPLGLGFGRIIETQGGPRQARTQITIFGGVFILGSLVVAGLGQSVETYAYRFALSVTLMVGVLWLPDRRERLTEAIAPLLLGIYILHPYVHDDVVRRVCRAYDWNDNGLPAILVIIALSGMLVALLRRTPLRSFL
jgi:surface polysaccharide O-acyltransferase-like enzyme